MKDGAISEIGTFNDLMEQKGHLSDFIKTFKKNKGKDDQHGKL